MHKKNTYPKPKPRKMRGADYGELEWNQQNSKTGVLEILVMVSMEPSRHSGAPVCGEGRGLGTDIEI